MALPPLVLYCINQQCETFCFSCIHTRKRSTEYKVICCCSLTGNTVWGILTLYTTNLIIFTAFLHLSTMIHFFVGRFFLHIRYLTSVKILFLFDCIWEIAQHDTFLKIKKKPIKFFSLSSHLFAETW